MQRYEATVANRFDMCCVKKNYRVLGQSGRNRKLHPYKGGARKERTASTANVEGRSTKCDGTPVENRVSLRKNWCSES